MAAVFLDQRFSLKLWEWAFGTIIFAGHKFYFASLLDFTLITCSIKRWVLSRDFWMMGSVSPPSEANCTGNEVLYRVRYPDNSAISMYSYKLYNSMISRLLYNCVSGENRDHFLRFPAQGNWAKLRNSTAVYQMAQPGPVSNREQTTCWVEQHILSGALECPRDCGCVSQWL